MHISTLLTRLPTGATTRLQLADPEADVYTLGFITEGKRLHSDVLYFGDSTLLATAEVGESPNLVLYGSGAMDEAVSGLVDPNVAFLVEDVNPLECYNALQACFLEDRKQQQIVQRMMNAHFSNGGLQYLIEESAMALGNPLVVVDTTYRYIAHHLAHLEDSTSTLAQAMTEEVRAQTLPDHAVSYIHRQGIDSAIAEQGGPLVSFNEILDCNTMTGAVMVRGTCIAHVMMMEHARPFTELDRACFTQLLEFVAQEMQKSEVWGPSSGEIGSFFLTNLLNERQASETVTQRRLKAVNFHPKPVLHVVCLHAPGEGLNQGQVEQLAGQLRPMLHHALYTRYHCNLVILVSRDEEQTLEMRSMRLLRDVAALNGLSIGLSNAFAHLTDTRTAYVQARAAIRLGESTQNVLGDQGVYTYRDYAYAHLLELANRHTDLLGYVHPALLRLMHHDQERGGELMETLFCYLLVSGTTKRAAELLSLHKNTLLYRMGRIREILGMNLLSGEDQFALQLSFRVLMYMGLFAPRVSCSREKLRD